MTVDERIQIKKPGPQDSTSYKNQGDFLSLTVPAAKTANGNQYDGQHKSSYLSDSSMRLSTAGPNQTMQTDGQDISFRSSIFQSRIAAANPANGDHLPTDHNFFEKELSASQHGGKKKQAA